MARVRGYWNCMVRQRAFLDEAAAELGLCVKSSSALEWRALTATKIRERNGRGLLQKYSSQLEMLSTVYPERKWEEEGMRAKRAKGFWTDDDNCRRALEEVRRAIGGEHGDWRALCVEDVRRKGAGGVVKRFSGSLFKALQHLYPEEVQSEHEIRPQVRKGYWRDRERRREVVREVARRNAVDDIEDWKRVKKEHFMEVPGGSGLLQYHRGSIARALSDGDTCQTPEMVRARPRVPTTHWEREENVTAFMQRLRDELHIRSPRDWLRVSREQILARRGAALLQTVGLPRALATAFPEEDWRFLSVEKERGERNTGVRLRASQAHLTNSLRGIFEGSCAGRATSDLRS